MRKIPFILTLILTSAWGYTSWYWYTCNIKGFCDQNTTLSPDLGANTNISEQSTFVEEIVSGTSASLQKLSASDVLLENKEDVSQTQTTVLSGTGNLETSNSKENLVKESQDTIETSNSAGTEATLCTANFVGPVALGAKNTSDQVELLERFLASQGEQVVVDGEYSQTDAELVKKFQLAYKEDILDPWGIAAPTGYVYTTTIKKMKEIACK